MLQTASGVGPKLAQAMLAVLSPDDLRRAVTAEDVRTLTQVPGIGQKGAQRIILELKDRIGPPTRRASTPTAAPVVGAEPAWRVQVREALVGPGLVEQGGRQGHRARRARRGRGARRGHRAAAGAALDERTLRWTATSRS